MFSDISKIVKAKSFSISPENFTGEKGGGARATEGTGAEAARELGKGWKISPSVKFLRVSALVHFRVWHLIINPFITGASLSPVSM